MTGRPDSQPRTETGAVDRAKIPPEAPGRPSHPGAHTGAGFGRSTSAVAVSIGAGLGLSFVLSVALARWLGAAEFGTYVYVMSWVAVFGTVGVVGLDTTLVRQLPVYAGAAAWGLMRGLVRWANSVTLVATIGTVGVALLAWVLISSPRPSAPPPVWLLAGVLLPLAALLRVQQSTLRGLRHPALGQVPESILLPALVLGLVGAWVVAGTVTPSAEWALLAQCLGSGIALVVAVLLVRRLVPGDARRARPRLEHRRWLATSLRMALLTGLSMLNGRIGILILGATAAHQVVGPYAAALRGSSFIPLAMNIAVLATAPVIAGAHAAGDLARVERLAGQVTRFALVGGLPVAVGLVILGRWFLLLFGPGFELAHAALVILIAGELVNIAAGPVATLLVMTGHERDATIGLAAATALNAGLTVVLVPALGITGAAIAAAASVVLWNAMLWLFVRHRLGFVPGIRG